VLLRFPGGVISDGIGSRRNLEIVL